MLDIVITLIPLVGITEETKQPIDRKKHSPTGKCFFFLFCITARVTASILYSLESIHNHWKSRREDAFLQASSLYRVFFNPQNTFTHIHYTLRKIQSKFDQFLLGILKLYSIFLQNQQ